MLSAAFNSISGFDDGSDTPKNYKDVLGHKNQAKWWESMNSTLWKAKEYGRLFHYPLCHMEGS
jgi:hypothetical protein